ncbi:GumC family protein [Marinilabilia rubra]|uniref:non-specific protein-tyrosine kinase n=1 Tax=Marinilabilia rubra TaxID=2162893 RepID=A0A2U2B4R1_9BACT|nr:polysaccharide biosynthesis tyrosine autokinase [Marinilabilia rubra]PWD98024.1 hypothetical protein DDZ16_17630 [Marinilabilia rubra]
MANYYEDNANEKNLNISKVLWQMTNYWYYFPIFFFITLAGAVLYQKTTTPEFRISTKLLISDSNEPQTPILGEDQNAIPVFNLGSQSNIENQLIIITSRRQLKKVLKQLDFSISYFQDNLFRTNEIYQNSPFTVLPDTSKVPLENYDFEIQFISKNKFALTLLHEDIDYSESHSFFEKIETPHFSFTIIPNEENISASNEYIDQDYLFEIRTLEKLAQTYQSNLVLQRINPESSIIEISITENNIRKGKKFLNKLAQNAVNYNLDKKNQIATNTINFIEKELVGVMDSLAAAESVLEDFRSRNEVMDVSFQGQMIITQSNELENEKATLEAKLDYLNYLVENIESNFDLNEIVAPSSMGVENPVLNQLIGEFASLNAEKSSLQFNTSSENPNIIRINRQIRALKTSILETTKSLIETTKISLADINNRLYQLSNQIRKLPKTEQTLLNIERRFRMNDEMYTYLLERRAEAQLAKSANLPDHEIVEEAILDGQVAPDTTRSALMVVVFGIMLPVVITFLKVYNNNKIQDENDIQEICTNPIIGSIPLSSFKKSSQIINTNSHSQLAEAFRSIRTSINFYAIDKTQKTILITSSVPGEGKTLVAANLASTFAHLGKNTLLVGFDLRMPAINSEMFPFLKPVGLMQYLIGERELENLVQTNHAKTMNVLPAGGVPPNPAELIANKKTEDLFSELKKQFEIIIIDSPPVGLVSDAYLLAEHSDLMLLITRSNVTPKPVFQKCLSDEKMKKMQPLGIVLNGIPSEKKGYSYYYESGEKRKRRKRKKLFGLIPMSFNHKEKSSQSVH